MVKIEELKACTLKIENTSKTDKSVFIYVPNKDSIPYVISAGDSIKITTLSAGESFCYFSQATDDIAVTVTTGD